MISLNNYQENPQLSRNIPFQSSTSYSLLGPNNEGSARKEGKTVVDEESIYEELDGGEEATHKAKRTSAAKRSAVISGGPRDYYNTLQFQES